MSSAWGDIFALVSAVSWALAVICFRQATFGLSSLSLTVFKTTTAWLGFVTVYLLWSGPVIPDWPQDTWIRLAVSGFLGVTVGDLFFILALKRLGASFSAIIDCSYVVFVYVIAFILFDEATSWLALVGGALVVGGVLFASLSGNIPGSPSRKDIAAGVVFGLLGQVSMVYGLLMIRDIFRSESIISVTVFRFAVGAIGLWVLAAVVGGVRESLAAFRPRAATRWAIPGVLFGPFGATLLWFAGFKYTLAGRAAIYNQMSSVLVVIMAAVFLHEGLSHQRRVSVALAVGGALLVSLS